MASGHAYRVNRPNTWLLRPMLQSEDSSCQPGAVHTWPIAAPDVCDSTSAVGESRHRIPRRIRWSTDRTLLSYQTTGLIEQGLWTLNGKSFGCRRARQSGQALRSAEPYSHVEPGRADFT